MTFKTIIFLFLTLFIFNSCSIDGKDSTFPDEISTEDNKKLNKKPVGDSANDLLSNTTYKRIVYEFFYVKDFKPTKETIDNFKAFVTDRLEKSKGMELHLKEITVPFKDAYTIDDIKAMEDNLRTQYNSKNKVAVFGIYLDAKYAENTATKTVLGIAYRNTSFAIFANTIKNFSNKPLAPSKSVLSSTVLQHEICHLLGLVNNGTVMQTDHQDIENGKHCIVENCLMHWTMETGEGLLNSINNNKIPTLDQQCIADLQANGGK